MSKYFALRTPCKVDVNGKSHTFHIRELGYLEFEALRSSALASSSDDKELAGVGLMGLVVLASVEEEDGSASYSEAEWRLEIKSVVLQLGKAALKVQGIDVDAKHEPMTPEEAEGNA